MTGLVDNTFSVAAWIDALKEMSIDMLDEWFKHCIENKGLVLNAWIILSNHILLIGSVKIGFTISDT